MSMAIHPAVRVPLRRGVRGRAAVAVSLFAVLFLSACEANLLDPSNLSGRAPRELDAAYEWIFEGFRDLQSVGVPAVHVVWELPDLWNGEPFRIYARERGRSGYVRIATVTSCGAGICGYIDRNVQADVTYEYYVATYNERSGEETPAGYNVEVRVPRSTLPPAPVSPTVAAMDDALFLQWRSGGAGDAIARYRVYLVGVDGEPALYETGRTDGTAFLDTRARNGHSYTYRIAAVDTLGHVSDLSASVTGVPQP